MAAVFRRNVEISGGRQRGSKLCSLCKVHKQEKAVLTTQEVLARPGHLVPLDFAGESGRPGDETGVVAARRLDSGSQVRGAVEKPDLCPCADGDDSVADGHPQGTLEVVVRQGQLASNDPDPDHFAGLVGRHEQRGVQPLEDREEVAGVLVPDLCVGRSRPSSGEFKKGPASSDNSGD